MRRVWLGLLLVMIFRHVAHAIDFSIKDPVVSNMEITLNASISASSNYYLQGVMRSQASSKYFGETQNNKGDWIDYVSSPEKEFIASNFFLTDIKNATWSGTIKLRFKLDDPNYLGPGLYDLKLRRFTGGSTSSAGESNTLTINLSAALPTPTPSPSPSPTSNATPTPSPSLTPTPSPKPSPTPLPSPTTQSTKEASVAGVSTEIDLSDYKVTPSPNPLEEAKKKPTLNTGRLKTVLSIGLGLILLSLASFFAYRRYLSQKETNLEG